MAHWRTIHETKHLGSVDLDGATDVTIERVVKEELEDGKGNKKESPVAILANGLKPMVLNVTNCKTLEKLTKTPDMDAWAGTTVTLMTKRVKAFGDVVDAIRIAPVLPQPKVDVSKAISALTAAATEEELKTTWLGLTDQERLDPKVLAAKDSRKAELSK